MWSHYADNHYGLCIKYRFSDYFLKTEERCTTRFRKIDYHDGNSAINLNIDKASTDLLLHTKLDNWAYENEIRLITYMPDEDGDFAHVRLDPDSYIESITFGYRCPKSTIKTIQNLLGTDGIEYYVMSSDYENIYSLKATPIGVI